jgi:hypothetical protein
MHGMCGHLVQARRLTTAAIGHSTLQFMHSMCSHGEYFKHEAASCQQLELQQRKGEEVCCCTVPQNAALCTHCTWFGACPTASDIVYLPLAASSVLPCHDACVTTAPLLLDEKAILTLDLLAPSSSGLGAAAGSSSSSGSAETLLQLLDRAASPAGRRLLRQWISRCDACSLKLTVMSSCLQHHSVGPTHVALRFTDVLHHSPPCVPQSALCAPGF